MSDRPELPPTTSPAAGQEPSPDLAPATGVDPAAEHDPSSEETPIVTGTLVISMVFMMMVFGFWITVYYTLLHR